MGGNSPLDINRVSLISIHDQRIGNPADVSAVLQTDIIRMNSVKLVNKSRNARNVIRSTL